MSNTLKLWTGLGVGLSVLVSAQAFGQDQVRPLDSNQPKSWQFAQNIESAGDAGEGGGEGGGAAPSTYALSSTDSNAFAYDGSDHIKAYVELVHDAYTKSGTAATALNAAIDKLLAAPTEAHLSAARTAWTEARPSYLRTEAFRFYDGPIEEIEGFINAWPMNEAYLDYVDGKPDAGIINDPSFEIGKESVRNRNQADDEANVTTGWHAIEFLLWGQDLSSTGSGHRPYTDYVAGTESGDRRRVYLKLLADDLVSDIGQLAAAWEPGREDNYAARFIALPQREAIDRMINGIAILAGFEFMSERLAVALDSGDQEDEHSCFSDTTKQDFVYDLDGIKQVWTGDSSGITRAGLDDLLRGIDSELASQIDELLLDAQTKVAGLKDPWDTVLAADRDAPERKAAEDVVVALGALADGFKAAGAKLGVVVLIPSG